MSKVRGWVLPEGLLWRAITTCLLILDYFLFATGNPSVLGRFLGGFSWLTLFAAAMIVSSYAPPAFSGSEAKPFYWLLSLVGVLSVVLFVASPYAHDHAAANMEAQILSFMKDPVKSNADVSPEERQLMVGLTRVQYHKERTVFIPTFREMDYHLTTEAGEKYRVSIAMRWDSTPVISVKRVDS